MNDIPYRAARDPEWLPGLNDHRRHRCVNPAPQHYVFNGAPISACGAVIVDPWPQPPGMPWDAWPLCDRCAAAGANRTGGP